MSDLFFLLGDDTAFIEPQCIGAYLTALLSGRTKSEVVNRFLVSNFICEIIDHFRLFYNSQYVRKFVGSEFLQFLESSPIDTKSKGVQ